MTTAPEHETLPGSHALPTRQRLMCHVDGSECEVLAPIMSALLDGCASGEEAGDSLRYSRRGLPCDRCRAAADAAARLPGTRLGQRERELLLTVPTEGSPVCAAGDARATREAKMRAARKLAGAGLVWTTYREAKVERRDRRRGKFYEYRDGKAWYFRDDIMECTTVHVVVAGLTPLGGEIKRLYARELEGGRPIRWDARVGDAASAVRQDAARLLADVHAYVADTATYVLQLGALVAQVNREGALAYRAQGVALMRMRKAIEKATSP